MAKKIEDREEKLYKDIVSIIRTTMRNNTDLSAIADNKANVLLSLNAIMITFIVPFVLSNMEMVRENGLIPPLLLMLLTCLITIYISTQVLKPGKFFKKEKIFEKGYFISPFFFGNFFQMEATEYYDYVTAALSDKEKIKSHLLEDLYYSGARLGEKMSLMRNAYNLFVFGLLTSMGLALILVLVT